MNQLRDTSVDLHRHTSAMQNEVMRTRMVPVGPLFNRFHRLVRDVSRQRGREAALLIDGAHTELDKRLVDALADPLTHLIRNSVDHGLESPDERIIADKEMEGIVRLSARHHGGAICIEVSDDGRGIDANRIARKAVEKQLVAEEDLVGLSDQEKIQFIFAPGFSTAAQVTDISGRGVGMDIVRSSIEALKGTISVRTELGRGTTFVIQVPLTLAMIDALLVELLGGGCYAFPLEGCARNYRI